MRTSVRPCTTGPKIVRETPDGGDDDEDEAEAQVAAAVTAAASKPQPVRKYEGFTSGFL